MANNNDNKWKQVQDEPEETGKSGTRDSGSVNLPESESQKKPFSETAKEIGEKAKVKATEWGEKAKVKAAELGEKAKEIGGVVKEKSAVLWDKTLDALQRARDIVMAAFAALVEKLQSIKIGKDAKTDAPKPEKTTVREQPKREPVKPSPVKTESVQEQTVKMNKPPEPTPRPQPKPTPTPRREPKEEREKFENPVRFRDDRRTGIIGGILYFVFVVGVSALIASFMWMATTDVLALGKPEETVEVRIPEGFDTETVTNELFNRGLIKYRWLFRFYAGLSSTPLEEKIDPGTYKLYTNYDYRALVAGMTESAGEKVYLNVTIPEGYSIRETFALLDSKGVCEADKLWDAAANTDFDYDFLEGLPKGDRKRLEGFLFPDTYEFYMDQPANDVIKKLLSNFDDRFSNKYRERAEEMGYSIRDIVTVASLIEKEAAGDADRAQIASVIYNRLDSDWFPFLNFDSTIWYIVRETGMEFSDALESDNPYNTYTQYGLPAGPIANPGLAAITAALYPADTNYYYYALDIYGEHQFFNDYDDFLWFTNSEEYGG